MPAEIPVDPSYENLPALNFEAFREKLDDINESVNSNQTKIDTIGRIVSIIRYVGFVLTFIGVLISVCSIYIAYQLNDETDMLVKAFWTSHDEQNEKLNNIVTQTNNLSVQINFNQKVLSDLNDSIMDLTQTIDSKRVNYDGYKTDNLVCLAYIMDLTRKPLYYRVYLEALKQSNLANGNITVESLSKLDKDAIKIFDEIVYKCSKEDPQKPFANETVLFRDLVKIPSTHPLYYGSIEYANITYGRLVDYLSGKITILQSQVLMNSDAKQNI